MSLTRRTLGLAGLSGLGLASCAPQVPAPVAAVIDRAVEPLTAHRYVDEIGRTHV